MISPRIFIGPMSKNIVDSVIELAEENNVPLALIPSRRQIDYMGGYSNSWKTSDWHNYVKSRSNNISSNILLARDHAGPKQGAQEDYGFDSLYEDCKYMDIIHIDPWKAVKSFGDGMVKTLEYIQFCHKVNPNVFFEIGTEESIFHYEADQLDMIISFLKYNLTQSAFGQIRYAVIQSGTSIKNTCNTGVYSEERLIDMVSVCHKYGLLSKEHNGDYLADNHVESKFKAGLDAINIAPEFGQIETSILLKALNKSDNHKYLIEEFYQICHDSQKWRHWVDDNFNPTFNKEEIIKITGHYVFSDPLITLIKRQFKDIDIIIKNKIKDKILCLLKLSEVRNDN